MLGCGKEIYANVFTGSMEEVSEEPRHEVTESFRHQAKLCPGLRRVDRRYARIIQLWCIYALPNDCSEDPVQKLHRSMYVWSTKEARRDAMAFVHVAGKYHPATTLNPRLMASCSATGRAIRIGCIKSKKESSFTEHQDSAAEEARSPTDEGHPRYAVLRTSSQSENKTLCDISDMRLHGRSICRTFAYPAFRTITIKKSSPADRERGHVHVSQWETSLDSRSPIRLRNSSEIIKTLSRSLANSLGLLRTNAVSHSLYG